jgi:hypothetical protein
MLIFNEAQTLSFSHRPEYFGRAFCYRAVQDINIKGKMVSDKAYDSVDPQFSIAYFENGGLWTPLYSGSPLTTGAAPQLTGLLTFVSGNANINFLNQNEVIFQGVYPAIYDLWDGMESNISKFSDFQDVILNGVHLGSGRVKQFKFPQSKSFTNCEYEVSLEIFKDVEMGNWSGDGYTNSINKDIVQYADNVSESFSFFKQKDGSINYSRELSFSIINNNLIDSGYLSNVKSLASGLFYQNPEFSNTISLFPDYYANSGNRIFSETYNIFDGKFSFSETFKGATPDELFFWDLSYSFESEENGANTVNEIGKILGCTKNKFEAANSGFNSIKQTSKTRVLDFYNNYVGISCGDDLFLKNTIKSSDEFVGSVNYNFSYSSDPFSNECFDIFRSEEIQKNNDGSYLLSEKGSIYNFCSSTPSGKLAESINYFKTGVEPNIKNRMLEIYSGSSSGCGCSGNVNGDKLFLNSKQLGYSEYLGNFDYDYSYVFNCYENLTSGIIVNKEITTKGPIHSVAFEVLPYDGEIAQAQEKSSLLSQSQIINAVGQIENLTFDDYLSVCIDNISPPTTGTYFVENINYLFDPDNSRMELSVNYSYEGGYRSFDNINV